MQDNLKLLEEYMKYFGTLKLQLKDNSQKHRRVIVMPLLLRWSFRLGQLPCDSTRQQQLVANALSGTTFCWNGKATD